MRRPYPLLATAVAAHWYSWFAGVTSTKEGQGGLDG
jgi:hypothetical protein